MLFLPWLLSIQSKIKYRFLHNCFDSALNPVPVGLKMLSLLVFIVPCIFHYHSAYCTPICIYISKFPLTQCFSTFFQLLTPLEAFWDRFPSLIIPIPLWNYNTTNKYTLYLFIHCTHICFYIKKKNKIFSSPEEPIFVFFGAISPLLRMYAII